jgi:hypothetical protein
VWSHFLNGEPVSTSPENALFSSCGRIFLTANRYPLRLKMLFSLRVVAFSDGQPVSTSPENALFSSRGRIFLTANRYPPPDQVRGHALPENARTARSLLVPNGKSWRTIRACCALINFEHFPPPQTLGLDPRMVAIRGSKDDDATRSKESERIPIPSKRI